MKTFSLLIFLQLTFLIYGFTQNTGSLISDINAIQKPVSLDFNTEKDVRSMKLFKDATIIGLGEATHGTHEFLIYKSKIVKYLIEELGLRLILFEIDFGESVILNDCLSDMNCDLHENIMKMQYYVWRTSEVESLFQFIREFNKQNPKDKVTVLGVDCYLPDKNIDLIEEYSNSIDIDTREKVQALLSELSNMQSDLINKDTALKFQYTVKELTKIITNREKDYQDFLTRTQYLFLGQALNTLKQIVPAVDTTYNNRDSLMAKNIQNLHDVFESKKTVFWAHNIHVANYHSYRPEKFTKNSVGYYLKSWHGDDYVSVGFGFSKGTFTAFSRDNYRVTTGLEIFENPKQSSLNYLCHHSKYPNFYLPMYKIKGNSDLGIELKRPMDFLHITSSFKEEWRKNLYIGKIHLLDYDYLVYFDNTSHSGLISN